MKESIQACMYLMCVLMHRLWELFLLSLKRKIYMCMFQRATPKDGPSAGVAIVTSIVSILTGIPVNPQGRHDRRNYIKRKSFAYRRLKEKLLAA